LLHMYLSLEADQSASHMVHPMVFLMHFFHYALIHKQNIIELHGYRLKLLQSTVATEYHLSHWGQYTSPATQQVSILLILHVQLPVLHC